MKTRLFTILMLGIILLTACSPTISRLPTRQADTIETTATPTPSATTGIPAEYQGKLKLFILAGQSNMSGRGEIPGDLKHTNPRVYVFGNDYQWKLAEEPVDSAAGQVDLASEDRDAGMSPSLSFAETLLGSKPGWATGLIPCAKGSSSLLDWQPDDDPNSLFGSCLKRIQQAAPMGSVEGILFYQGETDASDPAYYTDRKILPANEWAGEFIRFVEAWRNYLDKPDLPVVFAQLGIYYFDSPVINWEVIKEQQASVDLPNVRMIKTDDLELGDAVHLNVEGYLEVGRRFAQAYLEIVP